MTIGSGQSVGTVVALVLLGDGLDQGEEVVDEAPDHVLQGHHQLLPDQRGSILKIVLNQPHGNVLIQHVLVLTSGSARVDEGPRRHDGSRSDLRRGVREQCFQFVRSVVTGGDTYYIYIILLLDHYIILLCYHIIIQYASFTF